ncbi:MAG: AlkZ family DNA glycosylase, partial [Coriobacteriales bacterium]|nr:AlkZ family DNA glycosylase [Coriobacteriales bacterium]
MVTPRKRISQGELNRATLARQLLLERSAMSPIEMLEHLVGIQAQDASSWYPGFWTRLASFDPEDVSQLLAERRIVRTALMRSTIHLVTAEDALRLRPLLQPAVERPLAGRGKRRELRERGYDDVLEEARRLLDVQPMSNLELGRRLAERWPEFPPNDLAMAARVGIPLVQVTPRGLWGRSGAAKHAPLESWLGERVNRDYSAEDLVLRYLGAFGPASVADAQAWSGLTRLGGVFEKLRPRLRVFTDDAGRELFDLPDAPRPPADTPAPPRFLPVYDNVLLGHADRSRFVSDELRKRATAEIGAYSYGSLLVDGMASGICRVEKRDGGAELVIRLFGPLKK